MHAVTNLTHAAEPCASICAFAVCSARFTRVARDPFDATGKPLVAPEALTKPAEWARPTWLVTQSHRNTRRTIQKLGSHGRSRCQLRQGFDRLHPHSRWRLRGRGCDPSCLCATFSRGGDGKALAASSTQSREEKAGRDSLGTPPAGWRRTQR